MADDLFLGTVGGAAALALAGILALAAVVAGLAAALALAGVLALAAVVAGLAATLALAGVLPLAGVLFFLGLPVDPGGLSSQRTAGRKPLASGTGGDGACVEACHRATQQARERRGQYQRVFGNFHDLEYPFLGRLFPKPSRFYAKPAAGRQKHPARVP